MINEKCGLFAVCGEKEVPIGNTILKGLLALQHRGQHSAGAVIVNKSPIIIKNHGLVKEVFSECADFANYCGKIALGHVCYGKDCMPDDDLVQPLAAPLPQEHLYVAYNGCISALGQVEFDDHMLREMSDIAFIAKLLKCEIENGADIVSAMKQIYKIVNGAFCIIVVYKNKVYCMRDQYGFKPMCYGKNRNGQYVFSSETCALNTVGIMDFEEVEPGEIIVCDGKSVVHNKSFCRKVKHTICSFEYIYLSSRDSFLNGNLIADIRYRLGELLGKQHPVNCDVVVGVPRSGIDAAMGYAKGSGQQYAEGFYVNNTVFRTFISPSQEKREELVRKKLSPIKENVFGKEIIVVDDSVVRGTTAKQIVKMLRDSGARKIHYFVASPQVVNCCHYGVDIESKDTLITYNRTIRDIKEVIDADSVCFLELKDFCALMKEIGTTTCEECFKVDSSGSVGSDKK